MQMRTLALAAAVALAATPLAAQGLQAVPEPGPVLVNNPCPDWNARWNSCVPTAFDYERGRGPTPSERNAWAAQTVPTTKQYVEMLAAIVAGPNGDAERGHMVERLIWNVHGRTPLPQERTTWASAFAGGKSYREAYMEERARMRSNPSAWRAMVMHAYRYSYGRIPSPAEVDTTGAHTPRPAFDRLTERQLVFLYSPAGTTELTETVRRALAEKHNRLPTGPETIAALYLARQTKMPFFLMKSLLP